MNTAKSSSEFQGSDTLKLPLQAGKSYKQVITWADSNCKPYKTAALYTLHVVGRQLNWEISPQSHNYGTKVQIEIGLICALVRHSFHSSTPYHFFACRRPPSSLLTRLTFNIWKEHMSVSSTDIMAPALSNSPQ